jgi:hypothetical protein
MMPPDTDVYYGGRRDHLTPWWYHASQPLGGSRSDKFPQRPKNTRVALDLPVRVNRARTRSVLVHALQKNRLLECVTPLSYWRDS